MPYQYWPSFTSTDPRTSSITQLWLRMIEIWFACQEKAIAVTTLAASPHSGPRWPKVNRIWARGVVTAVTETVVTCQNDNGTTPTWCDNTYANPWQCVPTLSNPSAPTSWKLVIEDCDPRKVLICNIESWSSDTLTVPDLTHFVTERVVFPDLDSLVGKHFFIIKQAGSYWWSQRIPQWPNSRVWIKSTQTSSSSTSLTDTSKQWTANRWKDNYDLIYKDAGGVMRRANISGNSANQLTFGDDGTTPSGDYSYYIIKKDGLFQWDRVPDSPLTWYTGACESFYSLYPDDTIQQKNKPALQVTHGTGPSCIDTTFDLFDIDHWTDDGSACDDDTAWNAYVTKSLRYVQAYIEAIVGFFIKPGDYSGISYKPSPYCLATAFAALGINSRISTTGTPTGTGLPVTLSVPWTPIDVFYCIQDVNAVTLKSGTATYNGSEILGDFDDTDPVTSDYIFEDRTIVISLGWTRTPLRTFKYVYQNSGVFIPDLNLNTNQPIDPPTEPNPSEYGDMNAGPGRWVSRAASDHFRAYLGLGFGQESSQDIDLIANGSRARYDGDNFCDPGIYGNTFFSTSTPQPLVGYYARLWQGTHNRENGHFGAIEAQKKGVSVSGTKQSLTQDQHDWFDNIWYGRHVDYTETGTATGGSSTTLQDTSKAGSVFWDTSRGRPTNLILEILDDDGEVLIKMPIVGASGTTLTFPTVTPAQIDTFTPANVEIGDVFTLTIGSASVTFIATAATVANVTAGLMTAWNSSTDPLVTAITAEDMGDKVKLTANIAGVPFTVTASATNGGIANTQTLTREAVLAAVPFVVTAGMDYRWREARQRNRFLGRKILLTEPDGTTTHTVTCTFNDDRTLWWSAAAFTVTADWKFEIQEIECGTICDRVGGEWVEAVNSPPIKADQVTRYGRIMLGDRFGSHVLNEIINMLDLLKSTLHPTYGWTSRADPGVGELNHRESFEVSGPSFANTEIYYNHTYVYDEFDLLTPGDPSDGNPPGNPIEGPYGGYGDHPICAYWTRMPTGPPGWGYGPGPVNIRRVYAYPIMNVGDGDVCTLTSLSDFYVLCATPYSYLSPQPLADAPDGIACTGDNTFFYFQFDDNGDPVTCGTYNLFTSASGGIPNGTGITERRGASLGNHSLPMPNRPTDPGNPLDVNVSHGWEAVNNFAITNWDMTYVLPVDEGFFWWW